MKIIGFEILIHTQAGVLGRVVNSRIQYGASPVRDKRSMDAEIVRLTEQGVDFSVHPIVREGGRL